MKTIFFTLLLAGAAFACQDKSEKENDKSGHHEMHDSADHHHEKSSEVVLNNGEKWKANPETTAGIQNMIALTDSLPANPTQDDTWALSGKLDAEYNTIIEKCTMEGEAHNQLHNYLLPMKDMIEEIGSGDISVGKEGVSKLKAHLGEYAKYFE